MSLLIGAFIVIIALGALSGGLFGYTGENK